MLLCLILLLLGFFFIFRVLSLCKWQWAQRTDNRCSKKVIEWTPRIRKRRVGKPPARWTDDIVSVAESQRKPAAGRRGELRGRPFSSSGGLPTIHDVNDDKEFSVYN